jgi:hypothetical protein
METLALAALDDDDLAIVSAHLQDGLLKVKDMTWLQRDKQFAFVINRFVWERAGLIVRRAKRFFRSCRFASNLIALARLPARSF